MKDYIHMLAPCSVGTGVSITGFQIAFSDWEIEMSANISTAHWTSQLIIRQLFTIKNISHYYASSQKSVADSYSAEKTINKNQF